MSKHEDEMRLWRINSEIAALRFEYYELLITNRSLAMKLFGYRAAFPEKFTKDLLEKMERYVFTNREETR